MEEMPLGSLFTRVFVPSSAFSRSSQAHKLRFHGTGSCVDAVLRATEGMHDVRSVLPR